MLITVISITCTFAADNSTSIGTTDYEQSNDDGSDLSYVTLDRIGQANVEKPVTISGKVTDRNGNSLGNSEVDICLTRQGYGDEEYETLPSEVIETDDDGVYNYSYNPEFGGMLSITVKSSENLKDAYSSVFVAPKSTVVTMTGLNQGNVDEDIQITGRLTDCDGNPLRYTGVGVIIGGIGYGDEILWAGDYPATTNYVKEYVRTNGNGEYTYVYTPTMGGRLDVCVYYPGYHYYRFNSTRSHMWVMPKDTKVTVDSVESTNDGETVMITGSLHDVDDRPLRYTGVGIVNKEYVELDDMKTYVKTDSEGNFVYEYTPDKAETQDLIIYYPGYHYYRFNQTETTIDLLEKTSGTSINQTEDINVTDTLNETELLTDKNNNTNTNASTEIVLPEEKTPENTDYHNTTATDENETSECQQAEDTYIKPENVTDTTHSTDKPESSENTSSIDLPVDLSKVIITLDPIGNVTYGENVVISGRLTDEAENPITNHEASKIEVEVDSGRDCKKFVTTLDDEGKFNVTFNYGNPAYTLGEHEVWSYCHDASGELITLSDRITRPTFHIEGVDDYSEIPILNYYEVKNIYDNINMSNTLLFTATWTNDDTIEEYNYLSPTISEKNDLPISPWGYDTNILIANDAEPLSMGVGESEEHPIGFCYKGISNAPSLTYRMYLVRWGSGIPINVFKAQIEYGGEVYYYECKDPVYTPIEWNDDKIDNFSMIDVATLTISDGKITEIEHALPLTEHYTLP